MAELVVERTDNIPVGDIVVTAINGYVSGPRRGMSQQWYLNRSGPDIVIPLEAISFAHDATFVTHSSGPEHEERPDDEAAQLLALAGHPHTIAGGNGIVNMTEQIAHAAGDSEPRY